MYLNRRSCTASKAQLQSEKEKGETVERRGGVWATLSYFHVSSLGLEGGGGGRAFLPPYHQDNYEVVARVVSLLCRTETGTSRKHRVWIYLTIHVFHESRLPFGARVSRLTFQWGRGSWMGKGWKEGLDIYSCTKMRDEWSRTNERTNVRRWRWSENFRKIWYHQFSLNISRLILREEREKDFFSFLIAKERKIKHLS